MAPRLIRDRCHLSPGLQVLQAQGQEDGFVSISCLGVTFFHGYLTPNETRSDFQRKLDALEDPVLDTEGESPLEISMPGHLNGHASPRFERKMNYFNGSENS